MFGSYKFAKLNAAIRRAAGFWSGDRGVAAIEFAFIAPILLALYFLTMEVSQAVETNKKVGRIASMVADLVTQQQTIVRSELDAIMEIGASIIQPYGRSVPSMIVTAVEIDGDGNPTVAWSRKKVGNTTGPDEPAGTAVTVPAALQIPDTFLIKVRTNLDYRPVITFTADQKQTLGLMGAFDNISMGEQYFLRPRLSAKIPCGDC